MTYQNFPTASLTRRLAALLYDALVVLALYILMGGLLVTAVSKLAGSDELLRLSPAMSMTLIFSFAFLYYHHSWRKGGQTIGMKAWRLRLVTLDGRPLRLSHSMLRMGIGFFSLLPAGAGFWWALLDKQQRSWHDIASLTRVVHIPKEMQ